MCDFQIRCRDEAVLVKPEQIVRVELVSRAMHFYIADGEEYTSIYIRQSFEAELEELLVAGNFIQPHKSFIINMDYITDVAAQEFVMTDGAVIPISRNNAEVKKQYLEYLTRAGSRERAGEAAPGGFGDAGGGDEAQRILQDEPEQE